MNHVVLNDKQGRKNLNSIDKDIKHQIHTKQEKYSELRTRTLHHYQTQKVKEREEMEEVRQLMTKRDEKEKRAK